MGEQEPISIHQFVPPVALARTEPRNRFTPESSDYNEILDFCMSSMGDMKGGYMEVYDAYIRQSQTGHHSREMYTDEFNSQVFYPILIFEHVLPYLHSFKIHQEIDLENINPNIITVIERAFHNNQEDEEASVFLIQQAITILDMQDEEVSLLIKTLKDHVPTLEYA